MDKKIKKISMLAVIMAVTINVGFTSCSEEKKEPEPPDISVAPLMKKWYRFFDGSSHTNMYLEFEPNGSYSYVNEDETVNGNYRITKKEKGTYNLELYNGVIYENYNATLYKMIVSGSNIYNEMWAYYSANEITGDSSLYVYQYSNDTFVRMYVFSGNPF